MIFMRDTRPRLIARLLLLSAGSALSAAVVLATAGCMTTEKPQEGTLHPRVTVVAAQKMIVPDVVRPIGTTRALSDVTIRARVKGFLEEKHFDDGKNVKKGQLLLVIERRPYEVVLEQADARLASARASLERAEASKANLVSRARLALDQAQLSLDEIEQRRERNLLARKAASQDDYDKAEAQRKKSAAQVDADRASLEQAEADYRIGIASAKAEVAAAQAAVDDAKLNLSYCKMYSPIDGRIGELTVKVGNLVGDTGATNLVNVQQLDPMGLDLRPAAIHLPEATLLQEKGGLAVEVDVEGKRRHPYVGKTIFIDNQVDNTTSTFLVRAEVPNPNGEILPGQYITATIVVDQIDAVVVPEQAVLEGQEGPRVYVVDAANKAQVAKIKRAPIEVYQGLEVLDSGLEPGQKVIVEGIQLVKPGQVVAPVEVPLDQYRNTAPAVPDDDLSSKSRMSHLRGMDTRTETKGAVPGKAEPKSKKAEPASKEAPSGSQGEPGQPSAGPPEKKAR
jgi:membrane fusion protein, multidrug efflux system